MKKLGLTFPMEISRRETLLADAALSVKEDQPGTFTGYASVFGKRDLQDEIVDEGAFKRTLKHKDATFPLLWQHNRDDLIGQVAVEEDQKGLKVTKGELVLETRMGADAYVLLRKGMLKGMSIGFRTIKDEWDPQDRSVRHLKEVELWEVSLVTFPANPWAQVRTVKSIDALVPEARALLEGADTSEEKMCAAAAALMGTKGLVLPEDDVAFARKWIEKCYERAGRSAPWVGGQEADALARHFGELVRFAEEKRSVDLLRIFAESKSNPRTAIPFDWLRDVPEPEEKPFAFLDEMIASKP